MKTGKPIYAIRWPKEIPVLGIEEILKADGRKRYRVTSPWQSPTFPGVRRVYPTASTVRMTVEAFERDGCVNHSSMGLFTPYLVAYCVWKKISFSVTALYTDGRIFGYCTQKVKLP